MNIAAILSEAILSTQSDAIVAADQDGIICFWNPGAQRLFDYSSDEAIGKTLDLIIPERLRERHWGGYRRVMATGESRYSAADLLSVPALRKDGATISVEFTVTLLQSEGRVSGIVAIMRDVSQRFEEMRGLKRKLAELTKPTT
jgi:PAS domain S-box-containing protein